MFDVIRKNLKKLCYDCDWSTFITFVEVILLYVTTIIVFCGVGWIVGNLVKVG